MPSWIFSNISNRWLIGVNTSCKHLNIAKYFTEYIELTTHCYVFLRKQVKLDGDMRLLDGPRARRGQTFDHPWLVINNYNIEHVILVVDSQEVEERWLMVRLSELVELLIRPEVVFKGSWAWNVDSQLDIFPISVVLDSIEVHVLSESLRRRVERLH